MKPTDIKGLVNTIETLCKQHHGISDFKCDAELNFNDYPYTYPLVYLEREKQKVTNRETSTYSIALQVCDKPLSKNSADVLLIESKLDYIVNDIVRALTKLHVNLTDYNSISYDGQGEDMVMINRVEFTLTLGKSNIQYGDPFKAVSHIIIPGGGGGIPIDPNAFNNEEL